MDLQPKHANPSLPAAAAPGAEIANASIVAREVDCFAVLAQASGATLDRHVGSGIMSARTDIGGRSSNQDGYLFVSEGGRALFVMIDGMGGHRHGGLACEIIGTAIATSFAHGGDAEQSLEAASRYLPIGLTERVGEAPQNTGACVSAGELSADGNFSPLHLGDCRTLVIRNRPAEPVELLFASRDQTFTQTLLIPDPTNPSGFRMNTKTGVDRAIAVGHDISGRIGSAPQPIKLEPGDIVIMMTDGITHGIDNQKVLSLVAKERSSADINGRSPTSISTSNVVEAIRLESVSEQERQHIVHMDNQSLLVYLHNPPQKAAE